MSKFKVGDKALGQVSGDIYIVHGVATFDDIERVWVENVTRGGGSGNMSTLAAENLTRVKPFFEVGKKYSLMSDYFEPVRIDQGSNGLWFAYGKVTTPWGFTWDKKREDVFHMWSEA